MPCVLSIQSQVAAARVGNGAAVFALERLGVEALALPTVLFARRPDRGPPGGAVTPTPTLAGMLEALAADGALARVDAVLSGYLGEAGHADVALEAARRVRGARPQTLFVCDPVMGDAQSGYYAKPEVAQAITRRLAPEADLITPNAWELAQLSGHAVEDAASARAAMGALTAWGLVTSIPLGDRLGTLCVEAEASWIVETPRLPQDPKGAGDLLTALFLARRLLGASPPEALSLAVGAAFDVIAQAAPDGDLPLVSAQTLLVEPQTRPLAMRL